MRMSSRQTTEGKNDKTTRYSEDLRILVVVISRREGRGIHTMESTAEQGSGREMSRMTLTFCLGH